MRFVNQGKTNAVAPKLPPASAGAHIVGVFAHPLTLVCLVGWLLNDHVFKAAFGNVVTGKLSDIFGMVVFPLLLSFALPRGLADRRITLAIFATAAFFVSIKTVVAANAATLWLLDIFVPTPSIVLDPTDLLALPALAVAHWIWHHSLEVSSAVVRRVGWTAFGFTCLATMATSTITTSPPAVVRVEATESGFVALVGRFDLDSVPAVPSAEDLERMGPPLDSLYDRLVFASDDGLTWTPTVEEPKKWNEQDDFCVQDACYRLIAGIDSSGRLYGTGEVRGSGQSFRSAEAPGLCIDDGTPIIGTGECRLRTTPGPFDIAVGPDGLGAVVAMGSEGVGYFDGTEWTRVSVGDAKPRSFYERNPGLIYLAIGMAVIATIAFLLDRARRRRFDRLSEGRRSLGDRREAGQSVDPVENGETPDP